MKHHESDKRKVFGNKPESSPSGRRNVVSLIGLGLMMPLAACGQERKKMQKEIVLNVEMNSYLDRAISNIIFNGTDLGVMNKYGGTGTIIGVRIPFGIQSLKWTLGGPDGTPRNGEIITMKNQLVISPEQIPPGTRYLGLHLYPDDTAEIIFSEFIPETTARGQKSLRHEINKLAAARACNRDVAVTLQSLRRSRIVLIF